MNEYNLNIKAALNDFITLDNPQYAIIKNNSVIQIHFGWYHYRIFVL